MELATEFSLEKGYISIEERDRIVDLLKRIMLIDRIDLTDDEMKKMIIRDKKKTGTDINFIFTHGVGKAVIEKVPVDDVLGFYKRFRDKK